MMRNVHRGREALEAQVAVIFAIGLTAFLLILGLGVDFSEAFSTKTAQAGALEAVSQSCMEQANAVKFAQRPGAEARSQVIELLGESGFSGTARVWYVEAPESDTGPSDRFGGTLVVLEEARRTTLLSLAGLDELTVRTQATWVTHPYSSARVWRPASIDGGWEEVSMRDGRVLSRSSGSATIDGAPPELKTAIEKAMGG